MCVVTCCRWCVEAEAAVCASLRGERPAPCRVWHLGGQDVSRCGSSLTTHPQESSDTSELQVATDEQTRSCCAVFLIKMCSAGSAWLRCTRTKHWWDSWRRRNLLILINQRWCCCSFCVLISLWKCNIKYLPVLLQDCAQAFSEYIRQLRVKFSSFVSAHEAVMPDTKQELFSRYDGSVGCGLGLFCVI